MKFLIFPILLFALVNCRDYCNICRNHIACNNDNKIAAKCRDTSELIDLEDRNLNNLLVKLHNEKRNAVALGQIPNLKPATRMAHMQWDYELAHLAELNVKTCDFEHDECRNTKRYIYSGQNLAWWKGYPALELEKLVESLVQNWFDEYNDCTMSTINKYDRTEKPTGHFTIMVTDRNNRVGCGLLKTVEGSYTIFVLTCNYATNNIIDIPVYKAGPTASDCETENNKYPALCSRFEDIDPNKF